MVPGARTTTGHQLAGHSVEYRSDVAVAFQPSGATRLELGLARLTLQRLKRHINPGQRATLACAGIQENRPPTKCAAPGDDLSIEGAC
jgi:hypothetical protein